MVHLLMSHLLVPSQLCALSLMMISHAACRCAAAAGCQEHKNVIKYSKHYSWYYFHA